MDCSMPGFTVLHCLLGKLMSIQSVMPFSHLILCHPLVLLRSIFPSIRIFSNELDLHIGWPKCWSFSFSISSSNGYSGLTAIRDWLIWSPCSVRGSQVSSPSPQLKLLSRVQLFATPWTVAYQAPLSMEFSRQEYWSGLPFPSPGDLPDRGIEPRSPTL